MIDISKDIYILNGTGSSDGDIAVGELQEESKISTDRLNRLGEKSGSGNFFIMNLNINLEGLMSVEPLSLPSIDSSW